MLADANINPTPSKHKLPANERRAAIISSAIELFAHKGFRGTTTREIAAAVGVSEPVLYQHFATKSALYTAIVDHMMDELAAEGPEFEKMRETADARGCFLWVGLRILSWFRDGGQRPRLLHFSALEGHELARLWHEKATRMLRTYLESLVQKHRGQGLIRQIPDRVATKAFVGMVANYGIDLTFFECDDLGMTHEQVVEHFVDIFLHGIMQPAGAQQPAV